MEHSQLNIRPVSLSADVDPSATLPALRIVRNDNGTFLTCDNLKFEKRMKQPGIPVMVL
jgi:hypothetical protein